MDQQILDRAVSLATTAAMNGNPIKRIVWCPPATATQDAAGSFAVQYAGEVTGSDPEPWRT